MTSNPPDPPIPPKNETPESVSPFKRIQLGALRLLMRMLVRPYHSRTPAERKVAIIVPASARDELLPEEEISLRHLFRFLGPYDKYLIAPAGTTLKREGFRILTFPRKFFGSVGAHNQLLMWPGFYRPFQNYEYILIYHLDSLAFSDDLGRWCESGLDYVGAPWMPSPETPWVKEPRVGNGGFTLMRIESVLKVLANRYRNDPPSFWLDLMMRNNASLGPLFRSLEWLRSFFPKARVINRPLEDLPKAQRPDIHGCPNDYFWSFQAPRFLPGFKIASVEQGLQFAFEAAPRKCFELNGGRMPFGCHAWTKFDRAFWEPHLLPADGEVRSTVASIAQPSLKA